MSTTAAVPVEPVDRVFVGGVGGSGTRVMAALLRALGFHLGDDLNESLDNLWFTALFKRHRAHIAPQAEIVRLYDLLVAALAGRSPSTPPDWAMLEGAMLESRDQHAPAWLRDRALSLRGRLAEPIHHLHWAWKEPNSHIFAARLLAVDPALRYIHVARNGLDMAFSINQNQLHFWGPLVLPPASECEAQARRSLRYWCWSERQAQRTLSQHRGRVLWLRFEDLCNHSEEVSHVIAGFLDRPVAEVAGTLWRLVEPPAGIGRFRRHDCSVFRTEDVAFVASLGFPTV